MKTLSLAQKVFERLNERNPDLLSEIIDEIKNEERERRKMPNAFLEDIDAFGNCYSDADPGL